MAIRWLGDDDYRVKIRTPQDVFDMLDLIHSLAMDALADDSPVVEIVGRACDELQAADSTVGPSEIEGD